MSPVVATGLLSVSLVATGLASIAAAPRAPSTIDRTVVADVDTHLGDDASGPHGGAAELWAGFRDGVEYRAYLHFPLADAQIPTATLSSASLWLHTAQTPLTHSLAADFAVRQVLAPFDDTTTFPPWPATGPDAATGSWTTDSEGWKRINVTAIVGALLADPDTAHGLEVAAVDREQATHFAFVSLENADVEVRPNLILRFEPIQTPTPTEPPGTPTPAASVFLPRNFAETP
jgi:hypothetical protein